MPFRRSISVPSFPGLLVVFACFILSWAGIAILWKQLTWGQAYPDIVVGSAAWTDADKSRDYRAFILLIGMTAALSWVAAIAFQHLERMDATGRLAKGMKTLFLLCLLPAFSQWGYAVAYAGVSPTPNLSACLLLLTVAFSVLAIRRGTIAQERMVQAVGAYPLSVFLAGFAGLGVATILGRFWPALVLSHGLRAEVFVGAGAALAAVRGLIIAARAAAPDLLERRMSQVVMGVQVFLPLLFWIVIPPPMREASGAFAPSGNILMLGVLLATLTLLTWWQLGRRIAGSASSSIDLKKVLSPLALSSVIVFVQMPFLSLPRPGHDSFQFGEAAMPWQQIVDFGKLPYVDFVPIHGLMPLLRGGLNHVFFDGTAATFEASSALLLALFVVLSVVSVSALSHPLVALLMGYSLPVNDRFYFLIPALALLIHPRVLSDRPRWLVAWLFLCPIAVFYNAALGVAFVLATLPAAAWMACRCRAEAPQALRRLAWGAGLAVVVILILPFLRGPVWGLFWFVAESGVTNTVAHGVPWDMGFGNRSRALTVGSTEFLWEICRLAWIGVAAAALIFAWQEGKKPLDRRDRRVFWFSAMTAGVLVWSAPWSLGRIDPGHLSRTGDVSYWAIVIGLPMMALLGHEPRVAAGRAAILLFLAGVFCPAPGQEPSIKRLISKAFYQRDLGEGKLVDVEVHDLPYMGRVVADSPDLAKSIELKSALDSLLKPGETYLDLSDMNAFYFYLGKPVPSLYSSHYVAGNSAMQARMLNQLRATPPPAVLVSPADHHDGGPPSLRSFALYREFASRYLAQKVGPFLFLVEPGRAPEGEVLGSPSQLSLLEPAFRFADLQKIPAAWGRSWDRLSSRFESVAVVQPQSRGDGTARYDLRDLSISGARADFARVELRSTLRRGSSPGLILTWAGNMVRDASQTTVQFQGAEGTLLIPTGTDPRWLLSKRIDVIEIGMKEPAVRPEASFGPIELLRFKDLR